MSEDAKLYKTMSAEVVRNVDVYDEEVITPNDFNQRIDEIVGFVRGCSVKNLKALFISAMNAKGVEQDMTKFEPFCLNYADLFIRQVVSVVKELDYDTLVEFHAYTRSLSLSNIK